MARKKIDKKNSQEFRSTKKNWQEFPYDKTKNCQEFPVTKLPPNDSNKNCQEIATKNCQVVTTKNPKNFLSTKQNYQEFTVHKIQNCQEFPVTKLPPNNTKTKLPRIAQAWNVITPARCCGI